MNNVEKKPNRKNSRYILLFLLILLIALGRWKCPNHPEKEIEAVAIEEDSLELKTAIKSDVVVEQTTPLPKKDEIKTLTKKNEPVTLKAEEEEEEEEEEEVNPIVQTNSEHNLTPKIKEEKVPEETIEKTTINSFEETHKKEKIVYYPNKKIDKRLPASYQNTCNATTIFKIAKSSIQTCVDLSPDGSHFVVGNHNRYASVLNIQGKEVAKLIGHKGYVQSVKYSPDGKFIATGGQHNMVKLWSAKDEKEIRNFAGHSEGILSVAYSPNGKYIASGSLDHTTILWDPKSGKKLFQLIAHTKEVTEVAFSNNSNFIITGSSDGTAKVWDVESGKILYSLNGHAGVVGGVLFTPDNKLIVTSSVDKIRLWDAKTGKHIHTINDDKARIMSIFVSDDGQYLSASNVNGLVKIWKIQGGKKLCEYDAHSKRAREAVFHPTKKNTLVSAGNDNTIRMWEFDPG